MVIARHYYVRTTRHVSLHSFLGLLYKQNVIDLDTHLPVYGTCPTIVSREDAISHKKMF